MRAIPAPFLPPSVAAWAFRFEITPLESKRIVPKVEPSMPSFVDAMILCQERRGHSKVRETWAMVHSLQNVIALDIKTPHRLSLEITAHEQGPNSD